MLFTTEPQPGVKIQSFLLSRRAELSAIKSNLNLELYKLSGTQ